MMSALKVILENDHRLSLQYSIRPVGRGDATGALAPSHRSQRSFFCCCSTIDLKQSELLIFVNSYLLIV